MNNKLTAAQIFAELLQIQEDLTNLYDKAAHIAAEQDIHTDLVMLLEDEHKIASSLNQIMQRRGIFNHRQAPPELVDQAETKYNQPQK
ncbi:MAG: hypothetical protein FH749_15540 [Firmicutes bacterium]|nr:hypothetical protein [Bacillota bacterium]